MTGQTAPRGGTGRAMTLTVGSLFSGIGGLDLGFERAGCQVLWQVEINRRCQRVLQHHWPNVERHRDVRTLDPTRLAAVDIVVGGFPCQDLSLAGRRHGLAGTRSRLWWEFHRLLRALRPRWVVVENVPGLLSSGYRRDLGAIIGALAELGYVGAWRVLDAQYTGVAQRRRRVLIVGHLGAPWGAPARVLFEPDSLPGHPPPRRRTGQAAAFALSTWAGGGRFQEHDTDVPIMQCHGTNVGELGTLRGGNGGVTGGVPFVVHGLTSEGYDRGSHAVGFAWQAGGDSRLAFSEEVAPTLHVHQTMAVAIAERSRPEGRTLEWQEEVSYTLSGGDRGFDSRASRIMQIAADQLLLRRLTPLECERLQGFPDGWTDGQSDRTRYQQLGNAVAVPAAEWLARRIVAVSA